MQAVAPAAAPAVAPSPPAASELSALIAATAPGGLLTLTPGKVYPTAGGVNTTGKAITVDQTGATIQVQGRGYVKGDHGNKLTLIGGQYVGDGPAIDLDMAPDFNASDDYLVEDGTFEIDAPWAMKIVGAREGRCNGNTFKGSGVYMRQAVCPYFFQSLMIGKRIPGRAAFFYDGAGTGFDAGLVIDTGSAMGWDIGVDVARTDFFTMKSYTVDFNTSVNTRLTSQDGGSIDASCYLGSENNVPALQIVAGSAPSVPQYTADFVVSAAFTGHFEGEGYDCVSVEGSPDNITFSGARFRFYTRYGIRYALTGGRMTVCNGTDFAPRSGYGKYPIFNAGHEGDSNLFIADDTVFPPGTDMAGSGLTFARLGKPRGMK